MWGELILREWYVSIGGVRVYVIQRGLRIGVVCVLGFEKGARLPCWISLRLSIGLCRGRTCSIPCPLWFYFANSSMGICVYYVNEGGDEESMVAEALYSRSFFFIFCRKKNCSSNNRSSDSPRDSTRLEVGLGIKTSSGEWLQPQAKHTGVFKEYGRIQGRVQGVRTC
jgi:hypothetical protein